MKTSLDYEKLRNHHLSPATDAERLEMEREMAELFGEEPAVTGHVELQKIRRKWNLVVRFEVARGTPSDDPEVAAVMKALRSRPLWGAVVTIHVSGPSGGGFMSEVPTLRYALEALERIFHDPDLRDSDDEVTVEAQHPVPAQLAQAFADTRQVRSVLLGNGGVSGSPTKVLRVLRDMEQRTIT